MSDRFAYGRGRQRRNAPRGCGVCSTARCAPARQLSRAAAIVNKGKTTLSEARWQLVPITAPLMQQLEMMGSILYYVLPRASPNTSSWQCLCYCCLGVRLSIFFVCRKNVFDYCKSVISGAQENWLTSANLENFC